jgi:hypothetical protein
MTDLKDFHDNLDRMNAAQSKINIQNNIDNFAIQFAEWISNYKYCFFKGWYLNTYDVEMNNFRTTKELLQIFKEQRK